jgi:hypothetical protein
VSAALQTLLVGLFGGLMLVGIRLSLYFMSREELRPRAVEPPPGLLPAQRESIEP